MQLNFRTGNFRNFRNQHGASHCFACFCKSYFTSIANTSLARFRKYKFRSFAFGLQCFAKFCKYEIRKVQQIQVLHFAKLDFANGFFVSQCFASFARFCSLLMFGQHSCSKAGQLQVTRTTVPLTGTQVYSGSELPRQLDQNFADKRRLHPPLLSQSMCASHCRVESFKFFVAKISIGKRRRCQRRREPIK